MQLEKLVIWGASGFALVVANIIRLSDQYEIVGYLDDVNIASKGASFGGSKILGGTDELVALKKAGVKNIITGFGNGKARLDKARIIKENGFFLAKAIHPAAVISKDAAIGDGAIVGAGAVIDVCVKIGGSVIINRGALVGHECVIEDGANVGPGANLAGNVTIGRGAFVGIGSTVIEHVKIGKNSIIGAGSVVVKDIGDNVVAYGIPAKAMRKLP